MNYKKLDNEKDVFLL